VNKPWAVIQQETKFSELNLIQGGTASPYLSSSLPFLTTHQPATSAVTPYTLVASLDTEPVANSYSGEIHTHSSSTISSSIRSPLGSAASVAVLQKSSSTYSSSLHFFEKPNSAH
jgi:hypothetical protein